VGVFASVEDARGRVAVGGREERRRTGRRRRSEGSKGLTVGIEGRGDIG
jgi:hypothetical protein